jgi:hypothetical protein
MLDRLRSVTADGMIVVSFLTVTVASYQGSCDFVRCHEPDGLSRQLSRVDWGSSRRRANIGEENLSSA